MTDGRDVWLSEWTVLISRSWDPIVKYIKDQHSAYLRKELTAQRERYIQDTRVHCCLFFIQPSGHAYVLFLSITAYPFTDSHIASSQLISLY